MLAPVFRDAEGFLRVVLIRRTEGGIHGGQLALPGGNREPFDATPLDTAIREAEEEIGLTRANLEILASLPVVETMTTRYRIVPFLARVTHPRPWRRAESEIAEVLETRVSDLLAPGAHGEAIENFPTWSGPRKISFYRVGEHRLWGATYRILHPLLPRLDGGEWEI